MSTSVNRASAMAIFPASQGDGGAPVAGPGCAPNATGVLIYLNAGHELDAVLGRVDAAGGRVIMPRTTISESAGAFALFIDSEGNRLALHEAVRAASPTPPRTVHPVTVAGKVREAARRAGRKKPAARKTRKKRGTKRR
jgi:predicted enzyme related to lactoylglutathione lyase